MNALRLIVLCSLLNLSSDLKLFKCHLSQDWVYELDGGKSIRKEQKLYKDLDL